MRKDLLYKCYDNIEKLDSVLCSLVQKYEEFNFGIDKLRKNINKHLEIFDKYIFEIKFVNGKFMLDYFIYIDEYILCVDIEFLGSNDYLYFRYNSISVVSEFGEVMGDITTDCLMALEEE